MVTTLSQDIHEISNQIAAETSQYWTSSCQYHSPKSSFSPILFGSNVFGSTSLTTELNRLDFSIGSDEITCYKQSVVKNETIVDVLIQASIGALTKWSADNVGQNVRSLDSTCTLHTMGIIASLTGIYQESSDSDADMSRK